MVKIVLLTAREATPRAEKMAKIFKLLGMEVKKFSKGDEENLQNYEVILVEDNIYSELKTTFPYKIIVPLLDLEGKEMAVFKRMQDIIKSVVGEVILS